MKENQFDFVAPFYDRLASLIFGRGLLIAQRVHLGDICEGSKVLVVGGGAGKILQNKAFQKAQSIEYVELSRKMISKAKIQGASLSNISFIQQDFFEHRGKYDFIICNFFLDCFDEQHLADAVQCLCEQLSQNGTLLVTDFQPSKNLKSTLIIRLMLLFFKIVTSLQAKDLLDIQKYLKPHFTLVKSTKFKKDLIFSNLYRLNL